VFDPQTGSILTSVWRGVIAGVPVVLIRPADWNACNLFRGSRIYGGSYNELEAYLYFCRAGLEYLRASNQQPHVLHLHEWQTCAASMLYWEVFVNEGLYRPRVVLTIHNLDNTGECRQEEFAFTGGCNGPGSRRGSAGSHTQLLTRCAWTGVPRTTC
jgi:starch synthase